MAQQQKPAYQRGSDWNFLSGGGPENPSSAAHYYKGVEKDGRFKPGWQSLRPAKAIQADAERKQQEAVKEQRAAACAQLRQERLQQAQDKNRYNPITGQQRGSDGSLAPNTDPWQHQRVGVKAMEPRAAAADTLKAQAEQQQRSLAITEKRRERIANGGLARPSGGTAKDALTWGS